MTPPASAPEWGHVVQAVVAELRGDAAIISALGGEHIFRAHDTRDMQIPSVTWIVISTVKRENTVIVDIQIDIWAHGVPALVELEGRVLHLFDHDLPVTLNGLDMWSTLTEGFDVPDPDPGVAHRGLRFAFEPLRAV